MMFLKPNLPIRSKRPPIVETKACPGILAIWGSPGCGKTTTAVKIATHLANRKQNVVLLFCDNTAPMLPAATPPSEMECQRSLQSVLAATHISPSLVQHNLVTLKHNRYLALLGFQKGDNEHSCPAYDERQAKETLDALRETAPFVVVDCSSPIAYDILSAVALMQADNILRLANCDLKSISYLSSQLPLVEQMEIAPEKQYRIASNVEPGQPVEVLGDTVFSLAHSPELHGQFLDGNLLKPLALKNSRSFRKSVEAIVKEVFGV